jgi:mevalonate kinase
VVSLSREPDHPLALAVRLALEDLKASPLNLSLRLESNVPVASGLGSGAAVSAALMRAVASLFMAVPDPARLSALVYEVEKVHHGTPSGIDNTVVVYRRPIYFRKGLPPEFPQLASDLLLLLADSGEGSLTRAAVEAVRQAREADPEGVQSTMGAIGDLVEAARAALERGDQEELGLLFYRNHAALQRLGVSSPGLDALVEAARGAGALGAKLTGAGKGGHALVLVDQESQARVRAALEAAGARRVTACRVPGSRCEGPHSHREC